MEYQSSILRARLREHGIAYIHHDNDERLLTKWEDNPWEVFTFVENLHGSCTTKLIYEKYNPLASDILPDSK